MDLLASSGSLVTVMAAGKAVGTWAAPRPFGGVPDGGFAASVDTVGSSDRIRCSHHHGATRMGVVGERVQGFRWSGAIGGGGKVSWEVRCLISLLGKSMVGA